MTIECTFGRLKGRWWCPSKRLNVDVMSVQNVITACCVLHNVCEVQGEAFEDLDYVQKDNVPQPEPEELNNNHVGPQGVREAFILYFRGNV